MITKILQLTNLLSTYFAAKYFTTLTHLIFSTTFQGTYFIIILTDKEIEIQRTLKLRTLTKFPQLVCIKFRI